MEEDEKPFLGRQTSRSELWIREPESAEGDNT